MTANKTPGSYLSESNSLGSSIVSNETAIPAFIGFTEFAVQANGNPLNKMKGSTIVFEPVLVRSLLDYEKSFGKADTTGDLLVAQDSDSGAYTAKNEKKGAPYTPGWMHPSISNFFANGGGKCFVISLGTYEAFDDTVTADDVTSEITALKNAIKQAETTTLIVPTDLMRFGAGNYYTWGTELINFSETEKRYFTVLDAIQADPTNSVFDEKDISDYCENVRPNAPSYAAAYFPFLKSQTAYAYKDDLSNVQLNGSPSIPENAVEDLKEFLATNYITMPPSPFMVGIYNHVDTTAGVWSAPANVSPIGVTAPMVPLTNKQQEELNINTKSGVSINAIRSFTGRGTLVWGARTNDGNSNDWRYLNVRRLCIAIETDVSYALNAFVFEPNVSNTWAEVQSMIESYLHNLFIQGAFAGTTAATSYNVLVGLGSTMTDGDILNEYMRVSIQIAPLRPAEFVVLEFTQMVGQ